MGKSGLCLNESSRMQFQPWASHTRYPTRPLRTTQSHTFLAICWWYLSWVIIIIIIPIIEHYFYIVNRICFCVHVDIILFFFFWTKVCNLGWWQLSKGLILLKLMIEQGVSRNCLVHSTLVKLWWQVFFFLFWKEV